MALPILAAQAAIGVLRLAATKGVQQAVKKHGRELYNAAIATAKEAGKKGDQVRQALNRLATKSSDSVKKLPAPIKQIISKETATAANRAKLPKPIRDSLIKRGGSAATSTASRSGLGATVAKTAAGVTAAGTAASTGNQQSSPAISIRGGTDADVAYVKRKTAEANKKVGTGSSGPSTRQSNKTTKAPSTPSTPKAPSTSTSQGEPRSIAEAKKMGKDYFINKQGKRKAAVTAEELKASGMSLRDYLNKQQGKTRKSN